MSRSTGGYQPGDSPIPGYVLEEWLGAGQFGEVWKALAPGGIPVALKIIDLTRGEGVREFEALGRVKLIRHPNLTPIFGYWTVDDRHRVIAGRASEPADTLPAGAGDSAAEEDRDEAVAAARAGRPIKLVVAMGLGDKSLNSRLEECGGDGIPRDELLNCMEGAAKGLDYLHQPVHDLGKGPVPIIHRDIKPHNILIVGGDAQVCDFGLARAVENLQRSRTGTMEGTIAYMAPEVADYRPADARCDQYSLAISYVELRTGRLPFFCKGAEPTLTEVVLAKETGNLDLTRLPRAERHVIAKSTAKDPNGRYATCLAMVRALKATEGAPRRGWWSSMFGGGRAAEEREEPISAAAPPVPRRRESLEPAAAPKTLVAPGVQETTREESRKESASITSPLSKTVPQRPAGAAAWAVPPRRRTGRRLALAMLAVPVLAAGMVGADYLSGHRIYEAVIGPWPFARTSPEPVGGWRDDLEKALATRDFNAAAELLREPPSELDQGQLDEALAKVRQTWRAEVERERESGDIRGALAMVGGAPLELVGSEGARTELEDAIRQQSRPISGSGPWERDFESMLIGGRFADALRSIDTAPAEIAGTAAGRPELVERVRTAWIAGLKQDWAAGSDTSSLKKVGDSAAEMLRQEPFQADPQAALILARDRLRQRDYQAALDTLDRAESAGDLPADLRPLQAAIGLTAGGMLAVAAQDPLRDPELAALRGQLAEFDKSRAEIDRLTRSQSFWAPDGWETGQVDGLRKKVVDGLIVEADEQLGQERFAAARAALEDVRVAIPGRSPQDPLSRRLALWSAIVELHDPDAALEKVQAALETIRAEASRGTPPWALSNDLPRKIVPALGAVAAKKHEDAALANELDAAIALARVAAQQSPLDTEPGGALGALWKRRIAIRVLEPARPSQAELDALEKDWRRAEESGCRSAIVNAWRAECQIELGGNVSTARDLAFRDPDELPDKPVGQSYVHYVRARALRASAGFDAGVLIGELDEVFGDRDTAREVLAAQGRWTIVVGLLLDAVEAQREPAGSSAVGAASRAGPFDSPAEADRQYQLLARAGAVYQMPSDAALGRRMKVALALAAFYKSQPDLRLAWSQVSGVGDPAELAGASSAGLLSVIIGSYLGQPEDVQRDQASARLAVRACTRMIEAAGDPQGRLSDEQAVKLYAEWVRGVLAQADSLLPAVQAGRGEPLEPATLSDFYGALGRFIQVRRYAAWSFGENRSPAAMVEQCFTRAIDLAGKTSPEKLVDYYLGRGHARVELPVPKLDEALGDADAALEKAQKNLPGAQGLKSHVYLVRARQQPTRQRRVEDLSLSIEAGRQSIEGVPQSDSSLSDRLLNLSSAYVERANFARDPTFKLQEQDLDQAVAFAQQAQRLETSYPDYPFLAMGNAYEDLGWLVERDSEENYRKAVEAFTHAAQARLFASQAQLGLARCYYKAAANTYLDPAVLGAADRGELFSRAKAACEQARQADADMVDAHTYLGRIAFAELEDATDPEAVYRRVDQEYQKAKDLAVTQNLPSRAAYIAQWAGLPLYRGTGYQEASTRARDLDGVPAPPAGSPDPRKEKARIAGEVLVRGGDLGGAILEFSDGLPQDLSAADWSDISLLLARARCRQRQLGGRWDAEVAEKALADAERAADLAVTRDQLTTSHFLAAELCYASFRNGGTAGSAPAPAHASEQSKQPSAAQLQYLDRTIDHYRQGIGAAAKRDPRGDAWREGAILCILARTDPLQSNAEKGTLTSAGRDLAVALVKEAIAWQEERIRMAAPNGQLSLRTDLDTLQGLKAKFERAPVTDARSG